MVCFVFTTVGTFPRMSPPRRGAWAQTHGPPALAGVRHLISWLEREKSVQPQMLSAESAWLPAAAGLGTGRGAAPAGSGEWWAAAVWPPRFLGAVSSRPLAPSELHVVWCLLELQLQGEDSPAKTQKGSEDAHSITQILLAAVSSS